MKAALLALLMITQPVPSPGWGHYENETYGYEVDVPPGLIWRGESATGDGQDFTSPTVTLALRAEMSPEGFEAAIRKWRDWEAHMGWVFTYEMTTPTSAALSGRRAGWLIEIRALTICHQAMALLQLEYSMADIAATRQVVERLASSFKATRRC